MSNYVTDAHLEHIYEQIAEVCENTLTTYVAPKIEKMQRKNINEYVYKVYPTPSEYVRRKTKDGGLIWGITSKSNRVSTKHTSEISVFNRAKGFKKNLPMLVEYGDRASGYTYNFPRKGRAYMKARPFMQATFNELISKNTVEKILRKELKRAFMNVRMV